MDVTLKSESFFERPIEGTKVIQCRGVFRGNPYHHFCTVDICEFHDLNKVFGQLKIIGEKESITDDERKYLLKAKEVWRGIFTSRHHELDRTACKVFDALQPILNRHGEFLHDKLELVKRELG